MRVPSFMVKIVNMRNFSCWLKSQFTLSAGMSSKHGIMRIHAFIVILIVVALLLLLLAINEDKHLTNAVWKTKVDVVSIYYVSMFSIRGLRWS